MNVKPAARIELLHPLLRAQLPVIEAVFHEHDSLLTITSGHEGHAYDPPETRDHMKTSKHYTENSDAGVGCAIDCRGRHLTTDTLLAIDTELERQLGPDFDVVAELKNKMGHPRNHIHIEYDPKALA